MEPSEAPGENVFSMLTNEEVLQIPEEISSKLREFLNKSNTEKLKLSSMNERHNVDLGMKKYFFFAFCSNIKRFIIDCCLNMNRITRLYYISFSMCAMIKLPIKKILWCEVARQGFFHNSTTFQFMILWIDEI